MAVLQLMPVLRLLRRPSPTGVASERVDKCSLTLAPVWKVRAPRAQTLRCISSASAPKPIQRPRGRATARNAQRVERQRRGPQTYDATPAPSPHNIDAQRVSVTTWLRKSLNTLSPRFPAGGEATPALCFGGAGGLRLGALTWASAGRADPWGAFGGRSRAQPRQRHGWRGSLRTPQRHRPTAHVRRPRARGPHGRCKAEAAITQMARWGPPAAGVRTTELRAPTQRRATPTRRHLTPEDVEHRSLSPLGLVKPVVCARSPTGGNMGFRAATWRAC